MTEKAVAAVAAAVGLMIAVTGFTVAEVAADPTAAAALIAEAADPRVAAALMAEVGGFVVDDPTAGAMIDTAVSLAAFYSMALPCRLHTIISHQPWCTRLVFSACQKATQRKI